MKREFFLEALSNIEEDLLIEANVEKDKNKTIAENKSRFLLVRIVGSVAACVVLFAGVWIASQGGFGKVMMDNAAPEAALSPDISPAEPEAGDAAGGVLNDGGDYNYKAEAFSSGSAADDVVTEQLQGVCVSTVRFSVYKNGKWRDVIRVYPDGLPAAECVVNDYLAEAGSAVRCAGVTLVKTETADVALTRDPGEDTLRGLVLAVSVITGADAVRFTAEDGTLLTIGGEAPAAGFDPEEMREK